MRPPDSCARHTDASIQVSFWKKNWEQSSVLLLKITADSVRRTDTFSISTIINIDIDFFKVYVNNFFKDAGVNLKSRQNIVKKFFDENNSNDSALKERNLLDVLEILGDKTLST